MTDFLFTVYTIKTMLTHIEADTMEDAQEILAKDKETQKLSWVIIPETTYNFFSTGVLRENDEE